MSEGDGRSLVVDRRELSEEGPRELCEAEVRVPPDLVYFKGHFEGDPILPGVVQLDGAVLALVDLAWPDLEGLLRSVTRLKFISPVRPDDRLAVRLERDRANRTVSFKIARGGTLCTSGLLQFGAGPEP